MLINFRHGLYQAERDIHDKPVVATAEAQGIVIKVANSIVTWSIAHGPKNYTVTEHRPILAVPAQSLSGINYCWVYVDVGRSTGKVSYGFTTTKPEYGDVAPTRTDGQIWFDTKSNTTKVYSDPARTWIEHIRLPIGIFDGSVFQTMPFGSTVNIIGNAIKSGTIIYDAVGKAITDSQGRFLTTVDKIFTDGPATHDLMLEANITRAIANEYIPAFHVVKYIDFETIALAEYRDSSESVLAMSMHDAVAGAPVDLLIQGKVYNGLWNWPEVNQTLWVNKNGQFSNADPFDLNLSDKRRVPCARVIGPKTILFTQGLGGVGEKGDAGDVVNIYNASDTVKGVTKLSVAPDNADEPIAVGINDPILRGPRPPTEHRHPATEITVSPFGAFTEDNAQQAFLYLQNEKLSVSGGTVTGNIKSTVNAQAPDHLTTLQDVDRRIVESAVTIKTFTGTIVEIPSGN